ncbi:MAG: hypothetical protein AB1846_10650 [Chloroflexota bacterium]
MLGRKRAGFILTDGRLKVTRANLKAVAPMALRLRRSQFMNEYFEKQGGEEAEMKGLIEGWG